MKLAQIRADFEKRIARVEEQLKDIQRYPALIKALEVSSGAVYAVLGFDIDTLEGMEMLLHTLKTDDVYFYSVDYDIALNEQSIIEILILEQAARDFYEENIEYLDVTMDRNVLVQYSKYVGKIKNFWERCADDSSI